MVKPEQKRGSKIRLEPRVGVEPTTFGLRIRLSPLATLTQSSTVTRKSNPPVAIGSFCVRVSPPQMRSQSLVRKEQSNAVQVGLNEDNMQKRIRRSETGQVGGETNRFCSSDSSKTSSFRERLLSCREANLNRR